MAQPKIEANFTSLPQARAHIINLIQPNQLPTGKSTGPEITTWLLSLATAIQHWNTHKPPTALPISVHPLEIAFPNPRTRHATLLRQHDAYNLSHHIPETPEAFDATLRSWGDMATAAESYAAAQHTFYLVSAQPPRAFARAWAHGWFCGSGFTEAEARVAHAAGAAPSHRTTLYAQRHKWRIYDSACNFEPVPAPGSRRLVAVSGLGGLAGLAELLGEGGPGVVWTGGGGNDGVDVSLCREMACRWIGGEVLWIMGNGGWRVGVGEWEELKIN